MTAAADWATALTARRDAAKAAVVAHLVREDTTGGGRTNPDFLNALATYRDAQGMLDALTSATA